MSVSEHDQNAYIHVPNSQRIYINIILKQRLSQTYLETLPVSAHYSIP